MSRQDWMRFRPFLSVMIIILTLFSVVFLKMEVRRVSYSVLKLTRLHKVKTDRHITKSMEFAKLTRPERIERYAESKLELRKANKRQIIQLAGYMAERREL
jgi:cell division protein FtsL